MDLTPVALPGRFVTLEPLEERHAPDLFEVMQDEEVCRYLRWEPPTRLEETLALVAEARQLMERRQSIAFAQVWNATGRAIGSTRLLDVRPADRQVEIGMTFLARAFWRTPANTEAKLLLLTHCFERLGCIRVALKTDGRNLRSQEAIARLGAVREGTLRKHMNVRGYQRDTVYFSILDNEWPAVRNRLLGRLERHGGEAPDTRPSATGMVDARVRPVRASDAEDVYRLRHQPGTLAFTLAMPSERLEQERRFVEGLGADDHVLVAEVGGQVVGMAGLHVKAGKLRRSGEIGMMVRDDVQGRGIGKRLLEALLDIADNHLGLTRVELEVMAGNARAIALYERSGFAYEGCKRSAVRRGGRDEDLVIMGRVRVS